MAAVFSIVASYLKSPSAIIRSSQKTSLPLPVLCALVEGESQGRNVYGNDEGGVFATPESSEDIVVTKDNYARYRERTKAGEKSNGVGPCQITWTGFHDAAEREGLKLWLPEDNVFFGARHFQELLGLAGGDLSKAASLYRWGPKGRPEGETEEYEAAFIERVEKWKDRLVGTDTNGGDRQHPSAPRDLTIPTNTNTNTNTNTKEKTMSIPGIGRVLKDAGIEPTFTDGWKDRVWNRDGKPFDWKDIRAVTVHTTESNPSAFQRGEDAPTLQWVIDGQGYHTYSLLIGRSGRVYVISAYPGAQAGFGVWPHKAPNRGSVIPEDEGNSYSLGVAMDASVQHPPTRAQLDALARVLHALQEEWDGELEIIGHGEYNGWKVRTDPTGVPGGMDAVRDAAKRGTWDKPAHTQAAPATALSYVVRPGDTLYKIGRTFDVPATVIAKDNKIANLDEIVVGQELRIKPGARVHVVDKGESLWGIGRRYGLTPERLAALNGKKTSDTIYPGDILRIA